jgi:hypothetical protein
MFLKSGTAAVVAAGAVTALPGLTSAVTAVEAQGPADEEEAQSLVAGGEGASLDEPLIAHVRDLATGEIGLFSGTREITLLDPQLAARLVRATR